MEHQRYLNVLALSVTLLLLAVPRSGWAQFTYTTNNGAITITGYTGPGGNVNIPSTINGYRVTAIGSFAFDYQPTVTGVAMPDSVTDIGDSAFELCYGLTNVTIGNSVTNIGHLAFYDCPGLTSVVIPDSVTSIGTGPFGDCSGLTNITVNMTNSSFASSGGVLFDKSLITLIQFPGGLTGSYAVPGGVTTIGDFAFNICSKVTMVTIPDSVTNIGNDTFYGCSGLTSVTIPDSVISIGDSAFGNCDGLTNVTIGNNVISIGDDAFFQCDGLTYVTIPDSVINIGYQAFYECVSLTNVMVGNSVINIGDDAFYHCRRLASLTIGNSVINIGNWAFGNCSGLTNVTIPDSVTSIGGYAFLNCTNLHQAYFQGNAPSVNGGPGSADNTVFSGESGTVYYVPGATGWGPTFGGWPTAEWPRPQILGPSYGLGAKSNGFQFSIFGATNASVVVEASTNLQDWTPVITNTLINGTNAFSDSTWTNYPQRFYRVRSQ